MMTGMRILLAIIVSFCMQIGDALAAELRYTNLEYSYTLRLPAELPRRTGKAPAPQHGFALDLPSGGKIWVDGSYDAALYGSAAAYKRFCSRQPNSAWDR